MKASIAKRAFVALCIAIFAGALHAAPSEESRIQTCIEQAAQAFDIDVLPLRILREVEAGHLGTASRNENGTYDLGPMQINTWWLGRLGTIGITRKMLRDDPCINTFVAAWIFREEYRSTGDVVMAMARYHSPTPKHQRRYLALVARAIERNLAALKATSSINSSLASAP